MMKLSKETRRKPLLLPGGWSDRVIHKAITHLKKRGAFQSTATQRLLGISRTHTRMLTFPVGL